jgi:hypothetical protein
MTEQQPQKEAPPVQNTVPPIVINSTPEKQKTSEEGTSEFLKEMQESAGQISELSAEEDSIVNHFFGSLNKILKPFGKTLEISIPALPKKYQEQVSKAHLYLTGQLVLVYTNGEVEILNLADHENHEILVDISNEILMKLKTVITSYRTKTENRVRFLMPIAKELQKIAEVFSEK